MFYSLIAGKDHKNTQILTDLLQIGDLEAFQSFS